MQNAANLGTLSFYTLFMAVTERQLGFSSGSGGQLEMVEMLVTSIVFFSK